MYSIQLHSWINQVIELFYRIGFWHRGDEATAKELAIKWIYSILKFLFLLSLVMGAITSDSKEDTIFLTGISMSVAVLSVKFWIIIWKQKQILELLNRICIFTIRSHDDFVFVNKKLGKLTTFSIVFFFGTFTACFFAGIVAPFIGNEKTFFVKIAFPLDYNNSEINFWLAMAFLCIELFLFPMATIFSIIVWYLMLNCSLRYEALGNCLTKLGTLSEEITGKKSKISDMEKYKKFLVDLTASIDDHLHIKELINDLQSFCSNLFFVQIGTSGLIICGSIYCLSFNVSQNLIELIVHILTLFYNTSEIFMVTYFGNEVLLSSDRLSYCLFQSDWIEQPQPTKMCIIIFGEYLKQPHELLIGKLYPLTLETFTRILNFAYSSFNILKSFAE